LRRRTRESAAPDADARAADARAAILLLRQHRSAWPAGWPPSRAAELARLLEGIPNINDPIPYNATVLARLQVRHYQILAALVDLATSGGGNIEQGWLDTFGDQLTPDETLLLTRAATAEHRIDPILRWWDRTDERGAAEHAESGNGDAEQTASAPDPLATLAEAYRRTVVDVLDHVNGVSNADEDDIDDRASDADGSDVGEQDNARGLAAATQPEPADATPKAG
jgi:hypothetical protein